MKQEIIDELNERLNKYTSLLEAGADTAAAIELAGYAGSLAGLEWAKVITDPQRYDLFGIATAVKKLHDQKSRVPSKEEFKQWVEAVLK